MMRSSRTISKMVASKCPTPCVDSRFGQVTTAVAQKSRASKAPKQRNSMQIVITLDQPTNSFTTTLAQPRSFSTSSRRLRSNSPHYRRPTTHANTRVGHLVSVQIVNCRSISMIDSWPLRPRTYLNPTATFSARRWTMLHLREWASISCTTEVFVVRECGRRRELCTKGNFVLVAVDERGRPAPIVSDEST